MFFRSRELPWPVRAVIAVAVVLLLSPWLGMVGAALFLGAVIGLLVLERFDENRFYEFGLLLGLPAMLGTLTIMGPLLRTTPSELMAFRQGFVALMFLLVLVGPAGLAVVATLIVSRLVEALTGFQLIKRPVRSGAAAAMPVNGNDLPADVSSP